MTDLVNGAIALKTRELCQTIVDEPEFREVRQRLDAFMADPDVQAQYQELNELGSRLQQKQQLGASTDGPEYEEFETKRIAFLNHPVAAGFLDAQETIYKIRESVTRHVMRTFELGRLPEPEDLASCGCGSKSGCGH
jgi:cell fate (sporulation/competence/biofilm development) regulator YlbF (YheA/YmcA/DUF963 family)